MFRSVIVANLWDLVDCGIDESLDAIQSAGATGVSVTVTSRPVAHFRCWEAADPRFFWSGGGYFFQPEAARYEDTHIKPITATWLKQRNPLDAIADAAGRRSLELSLRISAFQTGRIAQRHPEAAAKTAYGDVSESTICPANHDVRALLRATVHDLAERYCPKAVEITDLRYQSGARTPYGIDAGFDPGTTFFSLLELCFSESSRQWALEQGVDPGAVSRWARVHLDKVLAGGRPIEITLEDLLADAEIPKAYVQSQIAALDSLIEFVCDSAQTEIALVLPEAASGAVLPSRRAAERAGHVNVSCVLPGSDAAGGASTSETQVLIEQLRGRFGPNVASRLELDASAACIAAPERLVATVRHAADCRCGGLSFTNFGTMPPAGLGTLRQAIRFAARQSTPT